MKKNSIQGMERSIDQWRNMVPHAVADGSKAQMEYALRDAKHDIDVLWRKITSLAEELAAVKEMYAREGAKALYELERAESAEARLAEAMKALDEIAAGDAAAGVEGLMRFALEAVSRVREGGKVDG